MPKTRKQNRPRRRRRNRTTKRGGAPLPTSYSPTLKQFLIDNYNTTVKIIDMYQQAGISFTDARRHLGNDAAEFTQAQVESLQQNGWSREYINKFNTNVPYELMLAYGSENHDDPRARSSPFDSDEETVVYRFEEPNDKFTFSEDQIERLIDLGKKNNMLINDMRIRSFEKEINDKTMTVDDVFQAIEEGDYQQPENSESLEQEQDQEPNNRSLHLPDLVVNSSSSNSSPDTPLYSPESADEESSNGRLHVSDLIEEESLYTPDSGSGSSRNGGKRKRGTMKKRGNKRKSSRKRGKKRGTMKKR